MSNVDFKEFDENQANPLVRMSLNPARSENGLCNLAISLDLLPMLATPVHNPRAPKSSVSSAARLIPSQAIFRRLLEFKT